MSTALLIVGLIIYAIGAIGIIVAAFREGFLWGLAVWFIPLVIFLFIALHWQDSKKPFLACLVGTALIVGGMLTRSPQAA